MQLEIITPERVVLREEVDSVTAFSTEGSFGVLPNHMPLVAPLAIEVLHYVQGGRKQTVAVMGGVFRTDGKKATVLCDAAELSQDIDVVRARHAEERAQARLKQRQAEVDVDRAGAALARANARLKAARG